MSKKFVVRCDHYSDTTYLFNQYEVFDSLVDTKGYFEYYKSLPDYDSFSLLIHPIVLMSPDEVDAVESFDGGDILVFRHDLIQKDSGRLTMTDVKEASKNIATPCKYVIDITKHLHGYENGKLVDDSSKFVEHLNDTYSVMSWFSKLPEAMSDDWDNISCVNYDEGRLAVRGSYFNSPDDNMEITAMFDVYSDKPRRIVPFMWEQIGSFMNNQDFGNEKRVFPKKDKVQNRIKPLVDDSNLDCLDDDFVILDI